MPYKCHRLLKYFYKLEGGNNIIQYVREKNQIMYVLFIKQETMHLFIKIMPVHMRKTILLNKV